MTLTVAQANEETCVDYVAARKRGGIALANRRPRAIIGRHGNSIGGRTKRLDAVRRGLHAAATIGGRHAACACYIGRVGAGRLGGRPGGAFGASPHSPAGHQAGPAVGGFRPASAAPQELRDRPRCAACRSSRRRTSAWRKTPCCPRRSSCWPGPARRLADWPAQRLLIRCWRLLFHARVHGALDAKAGGRRADAGGRPRTDSPDRPAAFDEIRTVLGQEEMLLPPRSDESIYVEFAATYLELRRFAPSFLPRYFPGWQTWRPSMN